MPTPLTCDEMDDIIDDVLDAMNANFHDFEAYGDTEYCGIVPNHATYIDCEITINCDPAAAGGMTHPWDDWEAFFLALYPCLPQGYQYLFVFRDRFNTEIIRAEARRTGVNSQTGSPIMYILLDPSSNVADYSIEDQGAGPVVTRTPSQVAKAANKATASSNQSSAGIGAGANIVPKSTGVTVGPGSNGTSGSITISGSVGGTNWKFVQLPPIPASPFTPIAPITITIPAGAPKKTATSGTTDYPHKCPDCGGPAYVGLQEIDCQAKCK